MSNKVALIDGDEIAYLVALRYQVRKYRVFYPEGDKTIAYFRYKADAVDFIENDQELDIDYTIIDLVEGVDPIPRINKDIDTRISVIMRAVGATNYRLFLSGDYNFRKYKATILPYKGNRDPVKPIHLRTVIDCLRHKGAVTYRDLEADDLLSIAYHKSLSKGQAAVICSSDKDLRTVPSWNYNITTSTLKKVSRKEAMYNFYYQLLIGDKVDNIPSPHGLGEKAAKFILDDESLLTEEDYYNKVSFEYDKFLQRKNELGEYYTKWYKGDKTVHDVLLEVGNLLYMRRTDDPTESWKPPRSSTTKES